VLAGAWVIVTKNGNETVVTPVSLEDDAATPEVFPLIDAEASAAKDEPLATDTLAVSDEKPLPVAIEEPVDVNVNVIELTEDIPLAIDNEEEPLPIASEGSVEVSVDVNVASTETPASTKSEKNDVKTSPQAPSLPVKETRAKGDPVKETGAKGEWAEAFDPNTKRTYWWNSETREVTWRKPDGWRKPADISSSVYKPTPSRKKTKQPAAPPSMKAKQPAAKASRTKSTMTSPVEKPQPVETASRTTVESDTPSDADLLEERLAKLASMTNAQKKAFSDSVLAITPLLLEEVKATGGSIAQMLTSENRSAVAGAALLTGAVGVAIAGPTGAIIGGVSAIVASSEDSELGDLIRLIGRYTASVTENLAKDTVSDSLKLASTAASALNESMARATIAVPKEVDEDDKKELEEGTGKDETPMPPASPIGELAEEPAANQKAVKGTSRLNRKKTLFNRRAPKGAKTSTARPRVTTPRPDKNKPLFFSRRASAARPRVDVEGKVGSGGGAGPTTSKKETVPKPSPTQRSTLARKKERVPKPSPIRRKVLPKPSPIQRSATTRKKERVPKPPPIRRSATSTTMEKKIGDVSPEEKAPTETTPATTTTTTTTTAAATSMNDIKAELLASENRIKALQKALAETEGGE